MKNVFRSFMLCVVTLLVSTSTVAVYADDTSEVILKLLVKKGIVTQQEVDEMKVEVAKSTVKAETPKTLEDRVASVEKDLLSKVGLDKLSSKLKLKGRFAAGYFNSQKNGTYPNGSFQAPEAKLQFTFQPDDINSVIMRMNMNNGTAQSPFLDYLYIDTNLMKLTPWEKSPFTLTSRLGRFKVDLGEETWSNNPVESILPSNSAANVAGSDEGLQLSGKIGKGNPLGWSAAIMNGNTGTGTDNNWLKAFSGKLYYNIIDPLYISASYYNSGQLDTAASEMSIGGITGAPTNARKWIRQMAEVDVRYDFKKGKTLNPPAYCDSLAFVKFAYGHFYDDAKRLSHELAVTDREGNYGYIEGLYNITKKLYAAGRASFVGLNGLDKAASFNSITTNRYERYSMGLGYRLSGATILKGEYSLNLEKKGTGGEDPHDDLFSLLIASQF